METISVKAKAEKEIFHNGDFYIIAFSPMQVYDSLKLSQYLTFTCKGSLSFITIGKEYELEIQELSTDKYGTSYKIVSCPTIDKLDFKNLSREESFEILMDCTSSERIANNILDAYENFIEIILTNGKEAIDVSKIHGVGDSYLSAYSRNLLNKYKYYALLKKYSCYEINNNDCKSLYEEFKEDNIIEKEMEKEPYKCLIDICKKSFERVDNLIIKNKPELESSEQRCSYFILFVLQKNELLGHTKINANLLYNYIIKNYTEAEVLKDLIVPVVKNSELFFYNEETKEVAKMDTYIAECKIANFVKEKINNSTTLDIDWTKYKEIKDGELTPEQSNILKEFCENNFIIVNSRGGTGKTSALMALIKLLEDNNLSYILLSPTGKVAKRIKEQTNRSAQTIHKACLSSPNGLYFDTFIIEEGSMLGIDLMCMLINGIKNPNARIVINMDLGQIAPISCGCPMRDIINSGLVKICNLTKVFRYGEGGLYKMATDAYDKKFYIGELDYQNEDRISIGKNKDYTYVRYNGKVEQVIEEYKKLLNRKIKPSDIAVITCWNVTDFGTINLNNKIQEIVNPNNNEKIIEKTIRKMNVKFKIGDLILNTNNNYNVMTLDTYNAIKESSILSKEDLETTSIMNGESGKILDIDNGNIIAKFDEDIVVLDKLMQNDLLLGYCITSYKIQGSEAPYTITLITPQFESSLNKNIIYTDMSRARKEVVEIIDPNTLLNTICIDATEERETNLLMLLLNKEQEI